LVYEKRYSERIRTDCAKDFILKTVLYIEYAKEVRIIEYEKAKSEDR